MKKSSESGADGVRVEICPASSYQDFIVYHLDKAGFEFDIATVSGNPVKFELWAFPNQDDAVKSIYQKYLGRLKQPLKLSDVIEDKLGKDSDYIALFIPGGHGARELHSVAAPEKRFLFRPSVDDGGWRAEDPLVHGLVCGLQK